MSYSNFRKYVFLAAIFLSAAAPAENKSVAADLLRQNIYPVVLEDGALKGRGAELILDLADGTQFVALGEEHDNFHIPDISTALFESLQRRYGYSYFMTEQDPVMMEIMSRPPVRGNPEEINTLAQSYPLGMTFGSDQELKMLADLGRLSSTKGDVIWGCDQGSGVTHTLDQLLGELQDEQKIDMVRTYRKYSAEKEAVRDYDKGHFIFDEDVESFVRMKNEIDPQQGTRAAWLLDVLINSSKIFDFYKNGNNNVLPGYYENNRFREEHLKDLCLAKYFAAADDDPLPKALMKFGSWHLYEGLSPTRVHTIGDFFSNVARFNGQNFLSIHFVSRPDGPDGNMEQIGFIWPFVRGLDADEFSVVDLRPFRSYPNRALVEKAEGDEWGRDHKEAFVRLVYGYDLIFFIGRTKAATFETVTSAE